MFFGDNGVIASSTFLNKSDYSVESDSQSWAAQPVSDYGFVCGLG